MDVVPDDRLQQTSLPEVEQPLTLLDGPVSLVGEIVSGSGERIDRGHVRAHSPRQEQ